MCCFHFHFPFLFSYRPKHIFIDFFIKFDGLQKWFSKQCDFLSQQRRHHTIYVRNTIDYYYSENFRRSAWLWKQIWNSKSEFFECVMLKIGMGYSYKHFWFVCNLLNVNKGDGSNSKVPKQVKRCIDTVLTLVSNDDIYAILFKIQIKSNNQHFKHVAPKCTVVNHGTVHRNDHFLILIGNARDRKPPPTHLASTHFENGYSCDPMDKSPTDRSIKRIKFMLSCLAWNERHSHESIVIIIVIAFIIIAILVWGLQCSVCETVTKHFWKWAH